MPIKIHSQDRRERLFRFIVDYKSAHDGNSPDLREMCLGIGLSPTNTSVVSWHLRALERERRLKLSDNKARSVEIVGGQWFYEPDLMPEHRGVELPESGAIAHVSPDVAPETLAALDEAMQLAVEHFSQPHPNPQTKYRALKKGEIIQEGDEVDASIGWNEMPRWVPANNIGQPAPDPLYLAHRQYRRPLLNAPNQSPSDPTA